MSPIGKVLRAVADDIERRLTPLCVCDQHGGRDVDRAVKRAAKIVRDCAETFDDIERQSQSPLECSKCRVVDEVNRALSSPDVARP